MTGEQRVQIAVDLTSFMRRMAVSRIRSEHPDWTERQVKREMLRIAFMPEPLPPASGDRPATPDPRACWRRSPAHLLPPQDSEKGR